MYMWMYGRYLQFSFPKWPLITTLDYGCFCFRSEAAISAEDRTSKKNLGTQPFYEIVHGKIWCVVLLKGILPELPTRDRDGSRKWALSVDPWTNGMSTFRIRNNPFGAVDHFDLFTDVDKLNQKSNQLTSINTKNVGIKQSEIYR